TVLVAALSNQAAQAQTFTSLASLDQADGGYVTAPLVQAINGNLYGTARQSGANSAGTLFDITLSGTVTPLYSFCSQPGCADGNSPGAGLVQATNGDLYGTTITGGVGNGSNYGTVFKFAPGSGTVTTIYDFCTSTNCGNGSAPYAGLVQASNGDLYGTTVYGGSFGPPEPGAGTVFKITGASTLTTPTLTQLYVFCGVPTSYGGCASGH